MLKNPFEFFASDDEEEKMVKVDQKKPRKTHQEKKQMRQAKKEAEPQQPSDPKPLPVHFREDHKVQKGRRTVPTNVDGHYLDKQSGTGRVDKPRKDGGGRGNIGNMKDERNKEKYEKLDKEKDAEGLQDQQKTVQEPKGITLDEYYKNKGLQLNTTVENQNEKKAAKKTEVTADWIKKEKLTVLKTKEDKKLTDTQPSHKKNKKNRNAAQEEEHQEQELSEYLSFGHADKPGRKQPDERKKPKGEFNINKEEFPALA